MKSNELLRRLRKLSARQGIDFTIDKAKGKGGHVVVVFGERFSVVPSGSKEIKKGTLAAICRQLGINATDL